MKALTKRESFLLLYWVEEKIEDLNSEVEEGKHLGYKEFEIERLKKHKEEWELIGVKIKSRTKLLKELVKV